MKGPNPAKRPNDARLRPGGARVPVTARIDPELDVWLRAHAASKGAKQSSIIETALAEYRERQSSGLLPGANARFTCKPESLAQRTAPAPGLSG